MPLVFCRTGMHAAMFCWVHGLARFTVLHGSRSCRVHATGRRHSIHAAAWAGLTPLPIEACEFRITSRASRSSRSLCSLRPTYFAASHVLRCDPRASMRPRVRRPDHQRIFTSLRSTIMRGVLTLQKALQAPLRSVRRLPIASRMCVVDEKRVYLGRDC